MALDQRALEIETTAGASRGSVFESLRIAPLRDFFAGQAISFLGTWMQSAAISWLAYRLTHSAEYLALLVFIGAIPALSLGPFSGALFHRISPATAIVVANAFLCVQATVLAVLTFTNLVQPWHLLVLSTLAGITGAVDSPARQAFILSCAGKHLTNATGFSSLLFNISRFIGPVAAGQVIASYGEGWCFAANAFSYLAVVVSVSPRRNRLPAPALPAAVAGKATSALRQVLGHHTLAMIFVGLSLSCFFGQPYQSFLPVLATSYGGGARLTGEFMSAVGFGAITGAIAMLRRHTSAGRHFVGGGICFGCALMALAVSRSPVVSLICLFVIGLGNMTLVATANVLLLTKSPVHLRGHVASLSVSAQALFTVGGLVMGKALMRFGLSASFAVAGAAVLLGVAISSRVLLHNPVAGS